MPVVCNYVLMHFIFPLYPNSPTLNSNPTSTSSPESTRSKPLTIWISPLARKMCVVWVWGSVSQSRRQPLVEHFAFRHRELVADGEQSHHEIGAERRELFLLALAEDLPTAAFHPGRIG